MRGCPTIPNADSVALSCKMNGVQQMAEILVTLVPFIGSIKPKRCGKIIGRIEAAKKSCSRRQRLTRLDPTCSAHPVDKFGQMLGYGLWNVSNTRVTEIDIPNIQLDCKGPCWKQLYEPINWWMQRFETRTRVSFFVVEEEKLWGLWVQQNVNRAPWWSSPIDTVDKYPRSEKVITCVWLCGTSIVDTLLFFHAFMMIHTHINIFGDVASEPISPASYWSRFEI